MSYDADDLSRRQFLAAGVLAGAAMAAPAFAKPKDAGEWHGKTVLVTGGTDGIGKQCAIAFAALGAQVVFCGRTKEKGEAVAHEITNAGGKALFVKADITSQKELKELFAQIEERFQRLDCAVNNAGIREPNGGLAEQSIETLLQTIDTNLVGTLRCLQLEIALMKKHGGGSIVNLGSNLLRGGGHPYMPAYTASKYGLWGAVLSLASRYAAEGIRINMISPGAMEHRMKGSGIVAAEQKLLASERFIPAGEVADSVVWLSSRSARGVNGANLFVDEGGVNLSKAVACLEGQS